VLASDPVKPAWTLEQIESWTDKNSWKNGQKYFAAGEVQDRFRTETTVFAIVKGSKEYRVSFRMGDEKPETHCTCPAYRRNKFCKHVVATLIAWVKEADTFIRMEENALESKKEQFKTKRERKKKSDKDGLINQGLDLVEKLVQEIGNRGFSMVSEESVGTLQELSEFVKSHKLRRLGNLLTELREELRSGNDPHRIFRLLSDAWFTASAIRKAKSGEWKNADSLDELIGKTWRKNELEPVKGLALLELAYMAEHLKSGFKVETSVFVDLKSGAFFTEKQITPRRISAQPKRSYSGVLEVAEGYLYPGREPRRIKLEQFVERSVQPDDVAACFPFAATHASQLYEKVREDRSFLFPQSELFILFRPHEVLQRKKEYLAVDESGKSVPLLFPAGWQSTGRSLAGLRCFLVFGRILTEPRISLQVHSVLTAEIPDDPRWLADFPVCKWQVS
jgi:uncharacterized Zn finger protein